jgi:repressor LexA
MKGITDRQKEVAEFISLFIAENGYSPSVRDIADHFGFSVKAAHDHLRALEKKEIIRTARGISRSIELLDESYNQRPETIQVPLLGTIAAGKPILSEENIETNLNIPVTMLAGARDTYFALRVRGESMIEAGINDGDVAVLKSCKTAERGEIVAASVEDDDMGGITLKKFYPTSDHVELRPANSAMGPIITRACHIHGILQLIIRSCI